MDVDLSFSKFMFYVEKHSTFVHGVSSHDFSYDSKSQQIGRPSG